VYIISLEDEAEAPHMRPDSSHKADIDPVILMKLQLAEAFGAEHHE
jgi:hypothetical protein